MEFLFLNESAGFGDDSSAYKDMVAFAESQGVDITEDATKSLTEVMLEAEEGFHEAEMTAMREEFALYQESVQDGEVLQEGFLQKVGQKLKQWWEAIKKFLIKLWGKIVHAFWVAVQWARKTIQSAIQKLHGSTTIWVPKSLEGAAREGVKKADELRTMMASVTDTILMKIQTVNKDGDLVIKVKSYEKALDGIDKTNAELKENVRRDVAGKKLKTPKQQENGNVKFETGDKGSMVQVPFSSWKKWMDDALKTYENGKSAADKGEKCMKKAVSDCDKEIETAYKEGKDSKVANLRKQASLLRMASGIFSKLSSKMVGMLRWTMGALFHYSSVKSSKKEKEVKI